MSGWHNAPFWLPKPILLLFGSGNKLGVIACRLLGEKRHEKEDARGPIDGDPGIGGGFCVFGGEVSIFEKMTLLFKSDITKRIDNQ